MTRLPPLFVIDDQANRLQLASAALQELDIVPDALHILQPDGPAEYVAIRNRLRTATGEAILLLDLSFRPEREALWPPVAQSLTELSTRTGTAFYSSQLDDAGKSLPERLEIQTASGVEALEGPSLDGLSLIETLIQNDQLDPCLVVICTGIGGTADLGAFLSAFNEAARKIGRRLIVVRERGLRDLETVPRVRGILRDLQDSWNTSFPAFSSAPRIDSVIREWVGSFRSLRDEAQETQEIGSKRNPESNGIRDRKVDALFCQHDHIEVNRDAYASILARGLDCFDELETFRDGNALKAVFMLDAGVSSSAEWPRSAFSKTNDPGADGFRGSAKPIFRHILGPVVKALSGLELKMDESEAKLPIVPGLPFLLSLCALSEALRNDDMLDTGEAIRIIVGEPGTRLSIPLKLDPEKEFGLARTWKWKVEAGGGTLNRGVCGSLWNVLRARVQVSSSAAVDDTERRLLQLFEGHDRPVVGVHFAPHFIHLYWN